MKIAILIPRLLVWAAAFALFSFASCRTPIVGSLEVQASTDSNLAVARFDGDTLLVVAQGSVTVEVFQKDGGQMFGPYTVGAGKTFIWSKSMDIKKTFDAGEPLPAWILKTGILRDGESNLLGLQFEAQQ